ncbi:uracil phosphoribosyltransferase [Saccharicrinis sp. FJH54]|uniref:uracil phosphoribosyltransferase n=1 Tax=Saccharicrinis sp. FJH54 TaxID=3344665 RepID=UPI0035D49139
MHLHDLSKQNSILNNFIAQIRDVQVQKDPLRFRRNIERIGELMAFEISKTMDFEETDVNTPLGVAKIPMVQDQIVLGTILRAGLPLHQGFLSYFDYAENSFVSAYRKYKDKLSFEIAIEYISSPDITGKTLIVTDPMLATGSSLELAYNALKTKGEPKVLHLACIIGSQDGVDYIQKHLPFDNVHLWIAAIDPELNDKSYIVPGLGDAGDLAYGTKL